MTYCARTIAGQYSDATLISRSVHFDGVFMSDKRGSDLLRQRYTEKDLSELLESTAAVDGARLVDFFPKGIPDPEGGWGVWHVPKDRLNDLLASLLKVKSIPNIKIFPKGIPFPDMFEVVAEAGAQRRT
jgi:hypothetical protein